MDNWRWWLTTRSLIRIVGTIIDSVTSGGGADAPLTRLTAEFFVWTTGYKIPSNNYFILIRWTWSWSDWRTNHWDKIPKYNKAFHGQLFKITDVTWVWSKDSSICKQTLTTNSWLIWAIVAIDSTITILRSLYDLGLIPTNKIITRAIWNYTDVVLQPIPNSKWLTRWKQTTMTNASDNE